MSAEEEKSLMLETALDGVLMSNCKDSFATLKRCQPSFLINSFYFTGTAKRKSILLTYVCLSAVWCQSVCTSVSCRQSLDRKSVVTLVTSRGPAKPLSGWWVNKRRYGGTPGRDAARAASSVCLLVDSRLVLLWNAC